MPIDKISSDRVDFTMEALSAEFQQRVRTPIEILTKNGLYTDEIIENRAQFTLKDLQKLADTLNKIMESFNIYARFLIHDVTKDIMVRIINANTREVIREVPPKKILDMVAKFMEILGMLIDEKA